jgi:hypothetical protein
MRKRLILCLIFLVTTTILRSQTAPVTIAGRVTNAIPGDPAVPVAIQVTGFANIGQFTLTMKFDTTRLHYVSAVPNPGLSGMTVTFTAPSGNSQAKLVFSWTGSSNVSMADGSSLANLTFRYKTGTGTLVWAYTFGAVCQYKTYSGANLVALGDTPKYNYYQNGGISNRSAPVTFAPSVADPVPGSLPLSIVVNNFTSISSFTLYLEYDPGIITYQGSFSKNAIFDASFQVGDISGFNGNRMIIMQWYGGAVSLPNGSALCTLSFNYPVSNCNATILSWYDSGPTCAYSDGGGDVLIDMPQADYYNNGIVAAGLPSTWTGANGTEWDNTANWDPCGLPDTLMHVVIPNVSPAHGPVINGPVHCKSVSMQPGADLKIGPGGALFIEP